MQSRAMGFADHILPLGDLFILNSILSWKKVYRIIDKEAFYGQDDTINMSVIILILGLALIDPSKHSHASQHAFALRLKV